MRSTPIRILLAVDRKGEFLSVGFSGQTDHEAELNEQIKSWALDASENISFYWLLARIPPPPIDGTATEMLRLRGVPATIPPYTRPSVSPAAEADDTFQGGVQLFRPEDGREPAKRRRRTH